MDVSVLTQELRREVPGLSDESVTKNILRTLRDCVDILWYEGMEDTKLQTPVILEPTMLIEFLHQVINHKQGTGVVCHSILSELPYWRELNADQEAMLAMKRRLQTFQLVHPASGEMAFDSDLIVPAFWKTNQAALWMFGGENLWLKKPRCMEIETVARRVHWEFRFTHFIPETLFDHLVVSSYSPSKPLEVGSDWLLYRDGELAACRVMISRHRKTHERSLLLEAVLAEDHNAFKRANVLWGVFTRLCKVLACVLKEHPGLAVTRFAHTDMKDYQPSLSSIGHATNEDETGDETWMPPEPTASECIKLLVAK